MNTTVIETTEHGEVPIDIYQKLSNDRILFICDEIDDKVATDVVATLLLKDLEDSSKKISIFLNSDGGDIRNILMIYDMMQIIQSPIETICIGSAVDEVALILAAGTLGMRFATKNSLISVNQLIHEGTNHNDLQDAKNTLDQYVVDNKKMIEIFAKTTKKSFKQVSKDLNRRIYLTANQAVKYGFIDKVIAFNK